MAKPLISKVDCIHLHVADLDEGLAFYCDRLGHELVWKTEESAGLSMGSGETEIVLDLKPPEPRTDLLVDSVDEAIERFKTAGGAVEHGPFEIPVGRAAVVSDPWGNRFTLLDLSKGTFETDAAGNILGVREND